MPKLNEVFGIGISVPKYTYVNRSGLDEKFKYLLSTDRHVVIHGSSKQGKTILRKKNLPETDSTSVQCRAVTTCLGLYTEILSQIGAVTGSTETRYGRGRTKKKSLRRFRQERSIQSTRDPCPGGASNFSTHFHSRINPLNTPPTPSNPSTSATSIRIGAPDSNCI